MAQKERTVGENLYRLVAPSRKSRLCLVELSAEQLEDVVREMRRGRSKKEIAKLIQGEWKRCTGFHVQSVERALAKLETRVRVNMPRLMEGNGLPTTPDLNRKESTTVVKGSADDGFDPIALHQELCELAIEDLRAWQEISSGSKKPITYVKSMFKVVDTLLKSHIEMQESVGIGSPHSPEQTQLAGSINAQNLLIQISDKGGAEIAETLPALRSGLKELAEGPSKKGKKA